MFKLKKLNDIIEFNPFESIAAMHIAKKVAMERLTPYRRDITGYELSPYVSGSKFRNGDTLLAKITPCLENGKTAFVDVLNDDEVGFGSTEFIVLRPRHGSGNGEDSIDPDFLYYLSVSPAFRQRAISCMEGTSGRKRVNEYTLRNHSLYIPESKEQRQIAAILSNIDKKIRLNAQINHNLPKPDRSSGEGGAGRAA
jgi:type I restriction enzyme S subunit